MDMPPADRKITDNPVGKPRIRKIPLPGGSGVAPTGAVQFEGDWPGLFIRGDEAMGVAVAIRELEQRLVDTTDIRVAHAMFTLKTMADLIDRDVKT